MGPGRVEQFPAPEFCYKGCLSHFSDVTEFSCGGLRSRDEDKILPLVIQTVVEGTVIGEETRREARQDLARCVESSGSETNYLSDGHRGLVLPSCVYPRPDVCLPWFNDPPHALMILAGQGNPSDGTPCRWTVWPELLRALAAPELRRPEEKKYFRKYTEPSDAECVMPRKGMPGASEVEVLIGISTGEESEDEASVMTLHICHGERGIFYEMRMQLRNIRYVFPHKEDLTNYCGPFNTGDRNDVARSFTSFLVSCYWLNESYDSHLRGTRGVQRGRMYPCLDRVVEASGELCEKVKASRELLLEIFGATTVESLGARASDLFCRLPNRARGDVLPSSNIQDMVLGLNSIGVLSDAVAEKILESGDYEDPSDGEAPDGGWEDPGGYDKSCNNEDPSDDEMPSDYEMPSEYEDSSDDEYPV